MSDSEKSMEELEVDELTRPQYKTAEIARMIGMTSETVRRRMRLLDPPGKARGFGAHFYAADDVRRLLKAFKKADD